MLLCFILPYKLTDYSSLPLPFSALPVLCVRSFRQRQRWQRLARGCTAARPSPLSVIQVYAWKFKRDGFLLMIWKLVWHIEWWYRFFVLLLANRSERFHVWFFFPPPPYRQPPVSESHWRTLLQDMLTMQQNVYACLGSDACYQVTLRNSLSLGLEILVTDCLLHTKVMTISFTVSSAMNNGW